MTRNVSLSDIKKLSLAELCAYLADKYTADKSALSGAVCAELAKRLTVAEMQPGGPYRDSNNLPTARVNAAVGRLFAIMGQPLPHVDAFIQELDESVLGEEEQAAVRAYHQAMKHHTQTTTPAKHSDTDPAPYTVAAATLETLSDPIKSQALAFADRVAKADTTGEIANIALFTNEALNLRLPSSTLTVLGEANIHAWIAYMSYDHVIDGEASSELIPTANVTMRLSFTRYKSLLPHDHPFQATVDQYFDEVDAASAWELTHARFTVGDSSIHLKTLPAYKKHDILASRSVIHILGPLIAAQLSSTPLDESRLSELTLGLRHYLIARQLSDDIHDWREDLAAGRISAVVTELLHHSKVHGTHVIDELTQKLQKDFLKSRMKYVSGMITEHSQQAKSHLEAAGCNRDSTLIELITRLEKLASAALHERKKLLDFEKSFTPPKTS